MTNRPEPIPALAQFERWPEEGDFGGLVGLHRNERIGPLPDWFLDELRTQLTSELATVYPRTELLYEELAASLEVPVENLLITPGTDAALRAVHLAYVRTGDAVVRLEPTYAMVGIYARMFGARAVPVAFDRNLELNIDDLLEAVSDGVRLAIIVNPNQPTGTLLPATALQELVRRCEAVGALLVLDETYYPFSRETALSLVEQSKNVLVLRSFSKTAGLAGLRIGYAIADPTVIRNLYKVRSAGEVNALALEAARLVVAHPAIMDDYVEDVATGARIVAERAAAVGLEPLPVHTNFILVRTGSTIAPADLGDRLRSRGYLVRCDFSAPGLEDCIRVTLGPPAVMAEFAQALEEAVST